MSFGPVHVDQAYVVLEQGVPKRDDGSYELTPDMAAKLDEIAESVLEVLAGDRSRSHGSGLKNTAPNGGIVMLNRMPPSIPRESAPSPRGRSSRARSPRSRSRRCSAPRATSRSAERRRGNAPAAPA